MRLLTRLGSGMSGGPTAGGVRSVVHVVADQEHTATTWYHDIGTEQNWYRDL